MKRIAAILIASLATTAIAFGDEILLGRIPISGVVVRNIDGCEVIYTMTGNLTNRPIDRVILHLDAMPALEKAETAAADGQLDKAMAQFDEAFKQASEPWQKSWVHYRRARVLNDAGRYTQACGVWATLLLTSVEPCWVDTMPSCKPDHPDEATAQAALMQLHKALDQAKPDSVEGDMIDLAIRAITTAGTSEANEVDDPAPVEAPTESAPSEEPAPAVPRATQARTVADDIDDLIAAGKTSDARQEIEKWVANTRKYPLDRLLYQYGQVLAAQGKPRDAAVRFMQCAILYADGSFAAPSLFETARLYAGPLNDLSIARRLLDRAQTTADPDTQAELVNNIRAALTELGSRK